MLCVGHQDLAWALLMFPLQIGVPQVDKDGTSQGLSVGQFAQSPDLKVFSLNLFNNLYLFDTVFTTSLFYIFITIYCCALIQVQFCFPLIYHLFRSLSLLKIMGDSKVPASIWG